MPIPPVLDRPLDPAAGPRVFVREFEVRVDGTPDTAWRGGAFVTDVRAALERERQKQPPQGLTIGQLEAMTRAISEELRADGLFLAQVFVPEQTVSNGKVVIQVMQGRLSDVVAEGSKSYSAKTLAAPFDGITGRPLEFDEVKDAFGALRDYPGLISQGVFSPGDEQGTTQLTLRVIEEDRFEYSASADNYGTEFTGEIRALFNLTVNNPTGGADRLFLSLLQTFDPTEGTFGAFSYTRPGLDSKNLWGGGYQRNDFDVAQVLAGQGIEGTTDIGNVFFSRRLVRGDSSNALLTVDLARKSSEVTELSEPIGEDDLTVLSLIFDYDFVDQRGLNQGSLGFSRGINDLFGAMDSTGNGGSSSRQGGSGEFAGGFFEKWNGTFSRLQRITDSFSLLVRAEAQYSSDLLVSLEQFSLGGPNSVRAYPPAEFLADSGGFASAEFIVSPGAFADGTSWLDNFQVSVFYDYAGGINSDPDLAIENKTNDIHGYGLGLRYELPGRLFARLEVATQASDLQPTNDRDPQYFASFSYSF